ncbi:pre-mRNA 3'-end-processing factor FIP1-like isoform X2 [Sinocyclocheilus grahami]|uniref:pre-mRNA 3'-end-processing factor FIP1-like isoform X1 n=1 Tax=Sinocyclocheilus grahami TaxID=75366 RepID=UPI0007ACBA1F|nr:PREDICTED: pre-mRNA 3'-end-processing factor FIP1-like isoform X1 [Sinocyclocheilus grahami]XP_016149743.1 PREDICTED: pre-mRNA 3'-end-processing factor FIP1-like isoform X2 [Sinocyclocheilus grahami]
MSATEAEKTADDDTDWLYGDDNFDEEETTEKEVFSALIGDVDGMNGLNYQESESDSDDDDDVCVTIGDIKTGGSQGSSFGSSSISLNIKPSVSGSKSRGLDLDAEGNVLQVDVESFEEKPWRKPGADLSDYFNYGLNEDTWKAYCDKQRRLRMSLEILSLGSSSKIMVHQNSSSDLSEHSSRKSSGSINVIGGQAGTISRVEGRRCHSADENNIQVMSEQSSDTELSSPKLLPFFPPNIPPPPFPPPSIGTTPPLIPPPPGFPLPPGAPPPMIPPLDSRRLAGGYDRRSATSYLFSAGVYSPAVGMALWSGVIDSEKAWENYNRHNKERVREKTRERGHKKERERERYRETDREHSPSSQDHRSEEERVSRHRDHSHYGSKRYRESSGRDGMRDRYRERRHRDRNEQHRSSHSGSSRRRHDSDDADSHRRHRHKRSRHNRGSLEPSEECSVDQENQSEATE